MWTTRTWPSEGICSGSGSLPTASPASNRNSATASAHRADRVISSVMSVPDDQQLDVEVETGTGALGLDLTRRLVAEALGTGLLIVAVIGSGIMASRLSPDDVGLQLLENSAATAG